MSLHSSSFFLIFKLWTKINLGVFTKVFTGIIYIKLLLFKCGFQQNWALLLDVAQYFDDLSQNVSVWPLIYKYMPLILLLVTFLLIQKNKCHFCFLHAHVATELCIFVLPKVLIYWHIGQVYCLNKVSNNRRASWNERYVTDNCI